MWAEYGLLLLIAAAVFAACQAGFAWGTSFTTVRCMQRSAYAAIFCTWAALAVLITLFIQDDFSVRYVAEHSYTQLPVLYKSTAAWGGHEGSLLLWIAIFASMVLVSVVASDRSTVSAYYRFSLGMQGLILAVFLGFVICTSHPFNRTFPGIPKEGLDLNPFLQDPLFVIHPPFLYMGYAAFAGVFACTVGLFWEPVLLNRAQAWHALRVWLYVATIGLTTGITLGSYWAYYELGWGGWWYWDPVENSALMPWLLAVALLHTVRPAQKGTALVRSTLAFALCGFLLSLLGTFLVRSGVLVSVHAFASDPHRGVFVLAILLGFSFFALLTYCLRIERVIPHTYTATLWGSSEWAFGIVGAFMALGTAVVLLGTLYPLLLDAFDGTKVSIGPPYFNRVMTWCTPPLFGLMGCAPFLRSGVRDSWRLKQSWKIDVAVAAAVFLLALLWSVLWHKLWAIQFAWGLACVYWIAAGLSRDVASKFDFQKLWGNVRATTERTSPLNKPFTRPSHKRWALWLAHAGIVSLIWGISWVSFLEVERDVAMRVGDTVVLGPYQFALAGMQTVSGPNYYALQATVRITHLSSGIHWNVHPERRVYTAQNMPVSETALDGGWWRDLYVALSEPRGEDQFAMRFYYKPMVRWIWIGGLGIVLGSIVGLWRFITLHTRRAGS